LYACEKSLQTSLPAAWSQKNVKKLMKFVCKHDNDRKNKSYNFEAFQKLLTTFAGAVDDATKITQFKVVTRTYGWLVYMDTATQIATNANETITSNFVRLLRQYVRFRLVRSLRLKQLGLEIESMHLDDDHICF
jgi:hypothetical protein